ncbi:MAG: hypothetical protein JW860_00160, partial [Sedimentisphaerales bacterium]|nr:hypothetical protein [Sedimentisphaerales bacterium]
TMLLGGLWHGASWTFVLWGALHGFYLIGERILKMIIPDIRLWHKKTFRFLLALITFGLVTLSWVFFRASGFGQAWRFISVMLGDHQENTTILVSSLAAIKVVTLISIIILVHWMMRQTTLESLAARSPWWIRSLTLAAMLIGIVVLSGDERAFVYFQF